MDNKNVFIKTASFFLCTLVLAGAVFLFVSCKKNDTGTTQTAPRPTPGYDAVKESDRIVISELMSDNTKFAANGVLGDWIEIYNAGETPLELSDFWISDKLEDPYLCRLPKKTLQAGEYFVLRGNYELTFGLSEEGESVTLTRRDGVASSMVVYENLEKNCSYTGQTVSTTPTPGYPNTEEGYLQYRSSFSTLIISEVISSNSKYKKLSGQYYDTVEILNASNEDINIGKYYFSDKGKKLFNFKLPDIILKPGQLHLVYCTEQGEGYPDFGISTDGETLFLTREDGIISDCFQLPFLPHNISYGRYMNTFQYYDAPTLGSANKKGCDSIAPLPVSSVVSGEYNTAVQLTLSGEGEIYYTTDGSQPTRASSLYTAGQVITFDRPGDLRMFAVKEGCIDSPENSYSYLVDIPDYSLPVISIAVDNELVFGENGVFNTSEKTELNARVTYFVDGKEEFSQGCGFKIFGGMTRFYKKKSFQLKFRGMYGKSSLEYKVFDDCEYSEFNSLVLRAGGQSLTNFFINDELGTSLASTSGNMPSLLVQSFKPANLYVNGQYMGIYYMREKIDEEMVANKLGVSPESVTVIDYMKAVKYGKDDAGWGTLWKFINDNDLTVKENYEFILSKFDIDSVIDFYIMQMWANNTDTGNVRVARSTEGDGKWRFILFDMDLGFGTKYSGAQTYLASYAHNGKPYNALIYKLLMNDEFYAYFMERFEMHMSSTLSSESVNARLDYFLALLDHDIGYEIDRWKDLNSNYNQSKKEWTTNVGYYLRNRRATDDYIERYRTELKEHIDAIRSA